MRALCSGKIWQSTEDLRRTVLVNNAWASVPWYGDLDEYLDLVFDGATPAA